MGPLVHERYRLIRLLGKGGMSEIYEAEDLRTKRRLALKTIQVAHRDRLTEIMARFLAEARTLGSLDTEHIARVYDLDTDTATGMPYMTMELLPGEDLERLLRRVGALEPLVAARLVAQAAAGLSKAHEQGVVHRDIKPANLFLVPRRDGTVLLKVLDFGIAKARSDMVGTQNVGLTQTGNMVGTPLYMSPEQAVGSRDIDTRTDVWSLGVVLYVALTGGEPFRGIDTLGKLILAICSTPIPPVQERAPWVPQELARLVSCALERSPSRRFADAGAMHQALSAWTGSDVTLPLSALTPVSDETRRTVEVRVAEQAASLLSAGELEALLGGGSPDDPGLSTFAGKRALELAEEQADVLATATTMIRGSKPAPSPIEEPTPGPVALAGTRGSRTPWLMALGGAALLGGLAWWQPWRRSEASLAAEQVPASSETPSAGSGEASASSEPSSKGDATPAGSADAQSKVQLPSTSVRPAVPVAPVHRPPVKAAPSARASASAPRVRPAYCETDERFVVDAHGIKTPRPECL
jgi:serine/threonine-protein kinase